ncbi:MAG: hypothetical protein IJI66_03715 [Erysipelotrichaceae bacterium]|nr:hypothetical protein [Erysipelotrichaceae bacterium]
MTLRQYKTAVRKSLIEMVGTTQADILMNTYKNDFQEFLDKNWSPATTATAMLMGY